LATVQLAGKTVDQGNSSSEALLSKTSDSVSLWILRPANKILKVLLSGVVYNSYTLMGSDTAFKVSGLSPNTSYTFQLVSISGAVESSRETLTDEVHALNNYLMWPTTTKNKISLQFGQVDNFTSATHTGVDIQGVLGNPVYSGATGKVVFAGYKAGYGNIIYINAMYEGKNIQLRYAHLQDSSLQVANSDNISAGTLIGSIGTSGNTSGGALLHIEVLESTNGSECNTDNSNTVRKNPLNYFTPISDDDFSYLSNPFAVGKVPGDTFSYTLSGSVVKSSSVDTSGVKTLGFNEELEYTTNQGLSGGKAYLRRLVEKYALEKYKIEGQSFVERNILTWNAATSIATINLNGRTKQYGVGLLNASVKGSRLVIDSQGFYGFFIEGNPTNINYIVTNYQLNDTETNSCDITLDKITNVSGKPLVDIRYIAEAFGGTTTWTSLRPDNSTAAILTMNFYSVQK
jgi:murein DD-endopeptidase MepM/ murein hydrolase activator NlpD